MPSIIEKKAVAYAIQKQMALPPVGAGVKIGVILNIFLNAESCLSKCTTYLNTDGAA